MIVTPGAYCQGVGQFCYWGFRVFGTRSSAGLSVLWQFMKFIYLCVVISHSLGGERGGEDREVWLTVVILLLTFAASYSHRWIHHMFYMSERHLFRWGSFYPFASSCMYVQWLPVIDAILYILSIHMFYVYSLSCEIEHLCSHRLLCCIHSLGTYLCS